MKNSIVPMYTCIKCVRVCVLLFLDLIGIVGGVMYQCRSMINVLDSTVRCSKNKTTKSNYADHVRMKNVICKNGVHQVVFLLR